MNENPMRRIRIEKITLNIGAGPHPEDIPKAKKILETISKRKVVVTRTRKRTTFNVPKGKEIGVMVTLRGRDALETLKLLLASKDSKLSAQSFDSTGNFSFGVAEYINIPGIKYDPAIGIMGLDVAVTLERPGYSIKRRRIKAKAVGKRHRITKEEAMGFAGSQLGVAVES